MLVKRNVENVDEGFNVSAAETRRQIQGMAGESRGSRLEVRDAKRNVEGNDLQILKVSNPAQTSNI